MTRSLRGRLMIGVVALVAVAMFASGATTYLLLQNFLLGRVDSQLATGHNAAIQGLGGPAQAPPAGTAFPSDTIIELVQPDGKVLEARRLAFNGTTTSTAVPDLPEKLPAASEANPAILTVEGSGGVSRYRAAIWPEDLFGGD